MSFVIMSGYSDGPLQLRITRMQSNNSLLKQGELLRCASDGNPLPEYTWLDASTGQPLHVGQQLTFDVCRHFNCSAQYIQNSNATVTLQCVATVNGQRWTSSDETTATFFVDGTCGMNASSLLSCTVKMKNRIEDVSEIKLN